MSNPNPAFPAAYTPTPPPQVAPPRKWRHRYALAGWLTVLVAMVAWCLVNAGFAVSFQEQRVKSVAAGTAWQTEHVTITMKTMTHGTKVTLPGQDPILADPNTVFVLVVLHYDLIDDLDTVSCRMTLAGQGRQWSPTLRTYAGEVLPGLVDTCSRVDADYNPTTSGDMGAVFEIPSSALSEIRGVETTVQMMDLSNGWTALFRHPYWTAVMEGTVS